MIAHLVLFRPRNTLSDEERAAFFSTMEQAFQNIAAIKRARVAAANRPAGSMTSRMPLIFHSRDSGVRDRIRSARASSITPRIAHWANSSISLPKPRSFTISSSSTAIRRGIYFRK